MNDTEWTAVKCSYTIGTTVSAVVTHHRPFGVLVKVEGASWGVIERILMERDGVATADELPAIGEAVEGEFLGFRDHSQQIELRLIGKA